MIRVAIILSVFCVLNTFGIVYGVDKAEQDADIDTVGKELRKHINDVYSDFIIAEKSRKKIGVKMDRKSKEEVIFKYVELDKELRFLFIEKKYGDFMKVAHNGVWDSKDAELGLSLSHQNDIYIYDGKLLKIAHSIDPYSRFRRFTLYSEVNEDSWCWPDTKENVFAALQYLKEFPDGPFAGETTLWLGKFYAEFYRFFLLYEGELKIDEKERYEVKFSEFYQYVEGDGKRSVEEQKKDVKEKAIKYLSAYMAISGSDKRERALEWIDDVENDELVNYSYFGCDD